MKAHTTDANNARMVSMPRLMVHVSLAPVLMRNARVVTILGNAISVLPGTLLTKILVSNAWKIVISVRKRIAASLAQLVSSGTLIRPPLNAAVAQMSFLSVPSVPQHLLALNARQIQ